MMSFGSLRETTLRQLAHYMAMCEKLCYNFVAEQCHKLEMFVVEIDKTRILVLQL